MEITMNITRIEETLARLEVQALELTMSAPSALTKHEHDLVHAEAKELRPTIDMMGGEHVQRLDRVQMELIYVNQRWLESQEPGSSKAA
jgi:hypothetical protein